MLRRFSYSLVMCCLLGMTIYMVSRSNQAADPPSPEAPSSASKPAAPEIPPAPAGEEADPFAVPEGNDEKALHLFITRITQLKPKEPTEAGIIKHFEQMDDAIAEILTRKIGDELYDNVAQLRFQIISILNEMDAESAAKREQNYMEQLAASPRAGAKSLLRRAEMQNQLAKFPDLDAAGQQAMIDEVTTSLKTTPRENAEELQLMLDVALDLGSLLERSDSPRTLQTYRNFSAVLKERQDERIQPVIDEISKIVHRMELPGKELELKGTTLLGKPFDIHEYRGKVVLVDFWGTWCVACVQELPRVKALYDYYHDKGLEIVGVNVDDERGPATKFTIDMGMDWVNLYEDPSASEGLNTIASKFGVSAFPTMFLVDREGKVVTVQIKGLHGTVNGTSIEKELAKLLGPPPKSLSSDPVEKAIEIVAPAPSK